MNALPGHKRGREGAPPPRPRWRSLLFGIPELILIVVILSVGIGVLAHAAIDAFELGWRLWKGIG